MQDGVAGAGIVGIIHESLSLLSVEDMTMHISDPSTLEMLACRDAVTLAQ